MFALLTRASLMFVALLSFGKYSAAFEVRHSGITEYPDGYSVVFNPQTKGARRRFHPIGSTDRKGQSVDISLLCSLFGFKQGFDSGIIQQHDEEHLVYHSGGGVSEFYGVDPRRGNHKKIVELLCAHFPVVPHQRFTADRKDNGDGSVHLTNIRLKYAKYEHPISCAEKTSLGGICRALGFDRALPSSDRCNSPDRSGEGNDPVIVTSSGRSGEFHKPGRNSRENRVVTSLSCFMGSELPPVVGESTSKETYQKTQTKIFEPKVKIGGHSYRISKGTPANVVCGLFGYMRPRKHTLGKVSGPVAELNEERKLDDLHWKRSSVYEYIFCDGANIRHSINSLRTVK